MENKVKVGIIGCGNISGAYLKYCKTFPILDVVAVSDIDMERAKAKAAEYHVPKAVTVDDLLADPEIEIVINLTVPLVHAMVSLEILEAGKHVYSEKPLATAREDGLQIIQSARQKNLLVGCAPDTFMGGGLQTCRKLIEDGWIGTPVAATAFMASHGMEMWHPNPEFFYKQGGGPVLDMGPYYLTALVNLMGPIRRVTGSTRITFEQRTITSQPLFGTKIKVETPTTMFGVLDFENGAVGTLVTSFDIWSHNLPRIEIYGSEGSLSVPDPNTFGGPVRIRRAGADAWMEVPLTHAADTGRGIGVADMAYAIRSGRAHRAHGDMALHVLDVMLSFEEASRLAQHRMIENQCAKPAPLPMGLMPGELD